MLQTANVRKMLRDKWPMPDEIGRLVGLALYDLYYGPTPAGPDDDGKPYPGFVKALEVIDKWASENLPGEAWIDTQCDWVQDSEPEPYEEDGEVFEPCWEDWWHVESVRKEYFGKLSEYL